MNQRTPGVRKAEARDLVGIARIHKAQFGTHLLGQYSVSMLVAFYGEFLDRAIFLVRESPAGVEGFVLGGEVTKIAICKAAFVQHNLLQCVLQTCFRPDTWKGAFMHGVNFVMRGVPQNDRDQARDPRLGFTLLSIAVRRESAGTGVAADLVRAFEDGIRPETSAYRLSVSRANDRATGFYRKMGFRLVNEGPECLTFERSLAVEPEVQRG